MRKKVCMVVPSFTAKGGITAVVNGYRNSQLTEDYDVRFIETYCDGNKIKKVAIYLKSMFKYLYALIFWRAEIIHIHSSFGGSFYRKKFFIDFGRLFNCKIVNHIHGSYYDEFYFKASNYKKKMVQKTHEKCNIFIVLNESAEKNLKQIVPDKQVAVIENYGILETSAIHNYKNRNENIVLFLGFVTEKKGCFDMPRISEMVLREVPDAQFVLGGVGELEKLGKLVSVNHFKFLGWIEGEKKKEWLERAKVFFLPSYSEAMPMSILEAMGYGLPVVASNVGGIPSIVRNNINGFTFIPGDVEGMAAAIIEILKNSKLANKLSENSAKIIAEEYSLKSHIDAVEKLYEAQA